MVDQNKSHVYRVVLINNLVKLTGCGNHIARETLKKVNWNQEAAEEILRNEGWL
jgi:hypothetical protein